MHDRWLFPVILVLALLAFAPSGAQAQRLGGVSAAIHGGGGGFGGGGGGGSGYRGGGYGRGYGSAYGSGSSLQLGGPWVSLYFPYYLAYPGIGLRHASMQPGRMFEGPRVVGIMDASAGYVFDGVVHGQLSGRVSIDGTLDIEARYGAYFEQTSDDIRELGLGRIAVAFPFVNEPTIQFRGGIAGQLYHDAAGIELGVMGLLELDAYPVEPLVIRTEVSAGVLGLASIVDARATIGLQIDRGELYLGYQIFAVNPFAAAGTALHGPVAGIRVWIS